MRVGLIPKAGGGGPASFQDRLRAELDRLGIETTFDLRVRPLDAVLVFAGTKDLPSLWKCRRDGIRIVQRLDGINWLHRIHPHGPVYTFRAEGLNRQLRFIRSRFADRIVYQSEFVREWWEGWFGTAAAPARVIRNGVPLDEYPAREKEPDGSLLVVEGNLHYNLPTREILRAAHRTLVRDGPLRRLSILARTDSGWEREWIHFDPQPEVQGLRPRSEVGIRQRNAALFLSMEINAPCPNSVIEALASGLPVIGFDTGSLRELVGTGGEVIPYDGDPWRLEIPRNLEAIGAAGRRVLDRWTEYSRLARSEAERRFNLHAVARSYLETMAD